MKRLVLVRHGQTSWSCLGKHTGKTDLPLTIEGRIEACSIREMLQGILFQKILVSPLIRAKETFDLLEIASPYTEDKNLYEWDYGEYEGKTSLEIHKIDPEWNLFETGAPGGESVEEVCQRADLILDKLSNVADTALVVSSGHFLRLLTTRWLGVPPTFGNHLFLSTGSISILGFEHEHPSILLWNEKKEIR